VSIRSRASSLLESSQDTARLWFESELARLGLSEEQIKQQTLAELEISLQKINDAIENPDSFGKLRLSANAEVGWVITNSSGEYHLEVGIMPLLLERKGLILERIKELRPEQQLNAIREEIVANVDDPAEREQLIGAIDRRLEEQRESNDRIAQEQERLETARAAIDERQQRLKIEISERRSAIYQSFLARESVASVVGAILLLALGTTLIIAMFAHVAASDVVANAFLLILGYFFGQATARDRDKSSGNKSGDS
jgi:uncharacterized membrane protein